MQANTPRQPSRVTGGAELVCDDYAGCKAGFGSGITGNRLYGSTPGAEFYDLPGEGQQERELAAQGLGNTSVGLCGIEAGNQRSATGYAAGNPANQSQTLADALHRQWMLAHRQKCRMKTGTAKLPDYSLKR